MTGLENGWNSALQMPLERILNPFYPMIVVLVGVILGFALGHPWIGICTSIAVLALWQSWWNCPFGFAISIWCISGILASTIPYLHMLRDWLLNEAGG